MEIVNGKALVAGKIEANIYMVQYRRLAFCRSHFILLHLPRRSYVKKAPPEILTELFNCILV